MRHVNKVLVYFMLFGICVNMYDLQNTNIKDSVLTTEVKSDTIIDARTEIIKPYSILVAETDVYKHEEEFEEELEDIMPEYDIPLSKELQEFTYSKCKEYEVEYELILAIMKTESNFKSNTVSKNSKSNFDKGLMQINTIHKKNFRKLGFTDMLDPYQNIEYGIRYFAELYHKFNGNEHYSLSAYNKGEFGWSKLLKRGITSTKYSRKVLKNKEKITK